MKPLFIKKSIINYLQPRTMNDFMKSDKVCIDRQGNLFNLPLKTVRVLNDSYWNHNSEHFNEKISFIDDYISFSFDDLSRAIYIDISNTIRPTTIQLETLKKCLEAIHHKNLRVHFAAWWRWPEGGGCAMFAQHRLPDIVMSGILKEVNEHTFKGYPTSIWYDIQE